MNNLLLNDSGINKEIKAEIKKFFETNKNKETTYQNLWETAKSSIKKDIYSNKFSHQKARKISINTLTSQLKELEKQEQTIQKLAEDEKTKIRTELKETET